MMGFASPCIYGCIIYPERNRAPFAQSLIVLRPISYLLFRLTHVVTTLTIIKDQIAGLEKGSTDLGNNAVSIYRGYWKFLYQKAAANRPYDGIIRRFFTLRIVHYS
ncbi:hypothetical protein VCRA2122O12_350032 [Vibrio crassostreae]|nr:hypothetical protein VCRA2114E5_320006 [Vibrio crassostreae]CAK2008876.1 hypothetical protein VCRA2110O4_340006 [Vibrio crassostreae]CAK2018511.1 hypothetical protein VCRA2110O1_350032 [Vibrio crassostreae]CAK2801335.1 hypothetical protein VCRA2110O3_330033 [Vibrio crassostreae]CAK2821796.1 hypothetical protein VCRA2110O2_340033 [Vibrio crassostreae]